jgi:hypothetical protein
MLKALLPLFALASFLVIGLAIPTPASAGGIVHTRYARNAQIICSRFGCRPPLRLLFARGDRRF